MNPFFGIEQFDQAALHAIQAGINPLLTAAMLFFTFFGSPVFWVGIAAALYWRSQENKGFFFMNLVLFTSAAVGALKYAFMRPRPLAQEFQVLAGDDYGLHGFPSGHAALIAATFFYTYKMIGRNRRAVFAIVVLLVAFSRLYLGMHFPSDIAAGLVLGAVIGKTNLFTRNRLFHKDFRPSKLEDELALVGLIAVAVLAVVFLRSLPMAGLFIGFYAGFFLFKEMQLQQSILLHKKLAEKYAIGFAFLAALLLLGENLFPAGILLNEAQRFGLYLLAGFWISWLWPIVFEKAFMAKQ